MAETVVQQRRFGIISLEDDKETAEQYLKEIDFIPAENKRHVQSFRALKQDIVLKADWMYGFIVDLRLGPGQKKEGLDAIKWVKAKNPAYPVFVYTNFEEKKRSKELGADFFLTETKCPR